MSVTEGGRWWVTSAARVRHLSPLCAAGAAHNLRQALTLDEVVEDLDEPDVDVDQLLVAYAPCTRCSRLEELSLADRGRVIVRRDQLGRRRRPGGTGGAEQSGIHVVGRPAAQRAPGAPGAAHHVRG